MTTLPKSFNPAIPEVYQIELTNDCNYSCDFCIRKIRPRPVTYIDKELVRTIADRDLGGSYFVELQMAGEPLLHPDFDEIVEILSDKGVLVGTSTNGLLIDKHLDAICQNLHYVTVSVDSLTEYADKRKGGSVTKLIDNIDLLVHETRDWGYQTPVIDLQIIEFEGYEKQFFLLKNMAKEHNWHDVNIRTVPDCFLGYERPWGKAHEVKCTELCLNPFMSCSIQADGDVVPCCFAFGKDVVLGNVKEKSLEEIWATSEELLFLREEHRTGRYRPICQKCYMRSPVLLHWQLYQKSIAKNFRGEHGK